MTRKAHTTWDEDHVVLLLWLDRTKRPRRDEGRAGAALDRFSSRREEIEVDRIGWRQPKLLEESGREGAEELCRALEIRWARLRIEADSEFQVRGHDCWGGCE